MVSNLLGMNQITLNSETVKKAVEFWLDSKIWRDNIGEVHVAEICYDEGTEQYVIDLTDEKPE